MSTHNIPFSMHNKNSALIITKLQLKNEFETSVVNKPSVFEPLSSTVYGLCWKIFIKKKKDTRLQQ